MTQTERPIYLDHNATTPVLPEVAEAMIPYLTEHFGNPSSGHRFGRRTRQAVEQARARVAELVGCEPAGVIFTSGGTEANNLAILGTARACANRSHVITSAIEHPATEQPCAQLERQGWVCDRVAVDTFGRVDVRTVGAKADEHTALVTIMHANNETGSVQPLAAISSAVRATGALVHTDAAQSVGKIPTRLEDLGVDMLSIAGHKLYAPKGVGALCLRGGVSIAPVLLGANHERGLRPGTENVAGIVGLGAACAIVSRDLEHETGRVRALRDRLWQRLTDGIGSVTLNGHPERRLPNTLNIRFGTVRGSALLERAPEVAASTGSACHDAEERPSAVLLAMGIPAEQALGSIRLSLGRATTAEDVDRAAAALIRAHRELTSR